MLSFLETILPDEGCYFAFVLQKKVSKGFRTKQELVEFIELQVALGYDVYHACASFEFIGKREKINVLFLRSIWFDYDYSKAGLDLDLALANLDRYVVAAGLPAPLVVASGGGLHVYWPFDRNLQPSEWKPLAAALRASCTKHQLDIDGGCTIDSARVLRPPGSYNHKPQYGEPQPVQLLRNLDGSYSPEDIGKILGAGESRAERRVTRQRPAGDSKAFEIPWDGPKAFGNPIADQCAQMRYFRETGCSAEGDEPIWKACMGVLSFCEDGADLAHEWSHRDPRYDGNEAQRKLDARKQTGPSTCDQFANACPSRCEGCPFKGKTTSPIGLGEAYPLREKISEVRETFEGKDEDDCPDPYFYLNGDLMIRTFAGKQLVDEVVLQGQRVKVLSVNRGEDSLGCTMTLQHQMPRSSQVLSMPACSIAGSNGPSNLAQKGILVRHMPHFRRYVEGQVAQIRQRIEDQMEYERFGWKEDGSFLVGNRLYAKGACTEVATGDGLVERTRMLFGTNYREGRRGSLEGWKKNVRGLLQIGYEPQRVALLASVGAILVHHLTGLEGGSIINFVFPHSGTGKSTGLKIAASVWGQFEGLRTTIDDTRVSQGIKFGLLCNLPIIFDELTKRSPDAAENIVRTFTNGTDKSRATITGEALQTNMKTWATFMISATNVSLIGVLQSAGRSTAMAERVLEFSGELPKGISVAEGDKYANAMMENCGHAGDLILRAITRTSMDKIKTAIEMEYNDIMETNSWPPARRYWARTIAILGAAGKIMHALKLIEFDPTQTLIWMVDRLNERGASERSEAAAPVDRISRFLTEHVDNTLVMPSKFVSSTHARNVKPVKDPRGNVYIRRDEDTNLITIDRSTLAKWLVEHDDIPAAVFKSLEVDGLAKQQKLTLGAGTVYASAQVMCVVINGAKLDG